MTWMYAMSGFYPAEVAFDFAGADGLADDFRAVARVLDNQAAARPGLACYAREQWQGRHGDQFDQRVGVFISDARMLAAALRQAAEALDAMAAAAWREQRRREAVHRWEEQQGKRNVLERWADNVHDFFMREDDIPPPPPEDPPVYRANTRVTARR